MWSATSFQTRGALAVSAASMAGTERTDDFRPRPVTEVSREAGIMTEDPRRRVDLRQHADQIAQAGARAPSHHNAQPWAFRVLPGAVEIHADRSRRLSVADPEDRQLFLGV